MSTCASIEPLLYLYRDRELSEEESAKVRDHCATCSRCSEILEDLQRIEGKMRDLRNEHPRLSAETTLATEILNRIPERNTRPGVSHPPDFLEELYGWLRPSFAVVTIFAVLALAGQLARDGYRVHRLEEQLASDRPMTDVNTSGEWSSAFDLSALVQALQGNESIFSNHRLEMPSSNNPEDFFGPAFAGTIGSQRGLIEDLSNRYPELSGINPGDRLTERERKILSTRGKAFIQEFEKLLRERGIEL